MLFEALDKLKHQIIISSVLMMILGLLLLIIQNNMTGFSFIFSDIPLCFWAA